MDIYEIVSAILWFIIFSFFALFLVKIFFLLKQIQKSLEVVHIDFGDTVQEDIEDLHSRIDAIREVHDTILRLQHEFNERLEVIEYTVIRSERKVPEVPVPQMQHIPPKRKPGRPFRNPQPPKQ